LDDWARVHWLAEQNFTASKRLVVIARNIDPDPLRDKVRSTWGNTDPDSGSELQRIAETAEVRSQHPAALETLAAKLHWAQRPDAALRLLREAQIAYPADFWLNFELAQKLQEKGNYAEAVRFYTAAVSIRPHAVAARNNLGVVLDKQKRSDEAITCYRTAIEIDPGFAVAYENLGVALRGQKKLDEAETCQRKAIELDPEKPPSVRQPRHYPRGARETG
jgi:tetratricopeptide (TPR) repeat protein